VEATKISMKNESKKRGRPAKIAQPIATDVSTSESVPLKVRVVSTCNNPTWVRGRIDGFRVDVKVPAQMAKRLIGKLVDVTLVNSDDGDYYQYIA
jgi:hypothetical protein